MIEANRVKYLRVALIAVGLIFIVGIYGLIMIWPSGWSWHSGPSHSLPHYLQMILGVYATLGVFLLIASRNPLANLSLIWFTGGPALCTLESWQHKLWQTRSRWDTFGVTSRRSSL